MQKCRESTRLVAAGVDDLLPCNSLVLDALRPTPQQLVQIPAAQYGAGWPVMGNIEAATQLPFQTAWYVHGMMLLARVCIMSSLSHP